ncbi:MAG TPA: nuclear transport factor 2 family protein [Vicinamibacteria bacterium]
MPTAKEVADQLVALCQKGKNIEAVEKLFSADAVSVEAMGDETMPAVMTGRAAIRGKNEWWFQNHSVHSASLRGPFPNGERFAAIYDFEVTAKAGPMAGQRMRMEEVALYTVADGKIVREEFFYDMAGASNLPVSKPKKATSRKPKKKAKARPAARKAKVKKRRR